MHVSSLPCYPGVLSWGCTQRHCWCLSPRLISACHTTSSASCAPSLPLGLGQSSTSLPGRSSQPLTRTKDWFLDCSHVLDWNATTQNLTLAAPLMIHHSLFYIMFQTTTNFLTRETPEHNPSLFCLLKHYCSTDYNVCAWVLKKIDWERSQSVLFVSW